MEMPMKAISKKRLELHSLIRLAIVSRFILLF